MENRRETLLLQITGQLNHMTAAIPRGPKSAFRKVLLGTDNVRGLAKLILDPFMGSGTVAKVCSDYQKNYIGFEINPIYIELSKKRLSQKRLF